MMNPLSKTTSAPHENHPVTRQDFAGLLLGSAFAAVLAAPLRHYLGPIKKVTKAKLAQDSFPISTYPMFSADRKGRIIVPHVVGLTEDGERIPLHYRHFGTGGLNQVRKQISRALREDRAVEVAQTYADSIHRNGGRNGKSKKNPIITQVLVVRSRFIFDDYFNGDKTPVAEKIHASCIPGERALKGEDTGGLAKS